jgi:hypothetical protein
MQDEPLTKSRPSAARSALSIEQTAAGYWTVQRGSVQLAFAMTRQAAEHERELLDRLSLCSSRRAHRRTAARA